jgi:hypothetical protein
MYKLSTSVYAYTGDASVTLNTLTHTTPVTTKTLADLSTNNYPAPSVPNQSPPNADNQAIFMNQPMTWWLSQLNTPVQSIKYAPVSNNVNWAYIPTPNTPYHIGRPVSDNLIPNSVTSTVVDPVTKVMTKTYVPKFGMSKVEVLTITVPQSTINGTLPFPLPPA